MSEAVCYAFALNKNGNVKYVHLCIPHSTASAMAKAKKQSPIEIEKEKQTHTKKRQSKRVRANNHWRIMCFIFIQLINS